MLRIDHGSPSLDIEQNATVSVIGAMTVEGITHPRLGVPHGQRKRPQHQEEAEVQGLILFNDFNGLPISTSEFRSMVVHGVVSERRSEAH